MQSDIFKFHLRKLQQLGYLVKNQRDAYELTAQGKEFANNLDKSEGTRQRQPKLSIVVLATRQKEGELQLLVQQRKRQPYLGYWGVPGGPVQWGEEFEDAGVRELHKQTGITATCKVRGFYRKRDYAVDEEEMLEDKLFVVLEAENIDGEIGGDWPWGVNAWMTLDEFVSQSRYFASVCDMFHMLEPGASTYTSNQTKYAPGEY
jgi:8-oxo-dGTP pyrophosphatase MutT (NUDIX family)